MLRFVARRFVFFFFVVVRALIIGLQVIISGELVSDFRSPSPVRNPAGSLNQFPKVFVAEMLAPFSTADLVPWRAVQRKSALTGTNQPCVLSYNAPAGTFPN
ncbi:hypothetical protein K239x_01040 [Planctomycetes bacterium K23_9]|uniref:Uncharacterized protein n=1 Tax=Stieleria marina TaxID=1930275 RepID=A0A517NM15_9BACT|nr:hypothetical protein K239x_01040 [Planctomycetes bacterium K23_9]